MSAWGFGPFENDDASDWLRRLISLDVDDPLGGAISAVLAGPPGGVDATLASEAIAAAALFCAILDRGFDSTPPSLRPWLAERAAPSEELRERIVMVLKRIQSDSELAELWRDTPDHGRWVASIDALCGRLEGAAADRVTPRPPRARRSNRAQDYACCFCGGPIPIEAAILVRLLRPYPQSVLSEQVLYAHPGCLRSALHPSIPLVIVRAPPLEPGL